MGADADADCVAESSLGRPRAPPAARAASSSHAVEPDPHLAWAVAALGERRGRLLHALEEAGAGRTETWPEWARLLVLASRTLATRERFAITLFLLGNGVLPRAVAAYLAGSGLLSDGRAHRHVECLCNCDSRLLELT